jgi:hypothetical protein
MGQIGIEYEDAFAGRFRERLDSAHGNGLQTPSDAGIILPLLRGGLSAILDYKRR